MRRNGGGPRGAMASCVLLACITPAALFAVLVPGAHWLQRDGSHGGRGRLSICQAALNEGCAAVTCRSRAHHGEPAGGVQGLQGCDSGDDEFQHMNVRVVPGREEHEARLLAAGNVAEVKRMSTTNNELIPDLEGLQGLAWTALRTLSMRHGINGNTAKAVMISQLLSLRERQIASAAAQSLEAEPATLPLRSPGRKVGAERGVSRRLEQRGEQITELERARAAIADILLKRKGAKAMEASNGDDASAGQAEQQKQTRSQRHTVGGAQDNERGSRSPGGKRALAGMPTASDVRSSRLGSVAAGSVNAMARGGRIKSGIAATPRRPAAQAQNTFVFVLAGRIEGLRAAVRGPPGSWNLILRTADTYPQTITIEGYEQTLLPEAWNRNYTSSVGASVKLAVSIRSLQWQGQYFSILRAHRLLVLQSEEAVRRTDSENAAVPRKAASLQKAEVAAPRPSPEQLRYCMHLAQERGRGVPAQVLADRRKCSSYISHLMAMPRNFSVSLSRPTNKGQIVPPLFPSTTRALQLIGHSKIKHAEPGQRHMQHHGNDAPGQRRRETSWIAKGVSGPSSMADAHRVEAAFVRLKAHASAARSAARIEAFLEPHPGPASLSRLEYHRQREAIAGADAGQGKDKTTAPSQCTRPMKRLKLGQESRVRMSKRSVRKGGSQCAGWLVCPWEAESSPVHHRRPQEGK